VDGYHHFRGPEDYRRDRRKDVRLQQLGYVVVRVLANDVVEEVDYVLQTIDAAMDRRMEAG
jgi:very-short-patch-repair endonuclease